MIEEGHIVLFRFPQTDLRRKTEDQRKISEMDNGVITSRYT